MVAFAFVVVMTGCSSNTDTMDDSNETTATVRQEEQPQIKVVQDGEFVATGQETVEMLEQTLKNNYDESIEIEESEKGPGFYQINADSLPSINMMRDTVWIETADDVPNNYVIVMAQDDEAGIQLSAALYLLTAKNDILFEEACSIIQEKSETVKRTEESQDWSEEKNIHFSFSSNDTGNGVKQNTFSVWYWK